MGWNDKSYVETLRDPQSEEFQNVIQILSDINDSDFDFDGSGTVDAADFEGDFVTEENINTMIKALTDPSATQRRTAHKAAAKFYADTEARRAFDFGVKDRPKTGEGDKKGGGKYGGFGTYQFNTGGGTFDGEDRAPKSQTWKDAQVKRSAIDALQTVRGTHATYVWNSEDNMYEVGDDQFTPGQVAAIEGAIKQGETEDSAVFKTTTEQENVAAANEAALVGEITSEYLQAPEGTTSASSSSENLNAFYNMPAYDYSFEQATMYRPGMGKYFSYYSDNLVALTDNDKNELTWDLSLIHI